MLGGKTGLGLPPDVSPYPILPTVYGRHRASDEHPGSTFGRLGRGQHVSAGSCYGRRPPCKGEESDGKTVLRDVRRATGPAKKPSSFCSFPDRVSTQSSLNLS